MTDIYVAPPVVAPVAPAQTPAVSAASAVPVPVQKVEAAVANPINALTDFLGSANVQKALGLAQTAIAGLTAGEGKSLGSHVAGMTVGAAFTLGVHFVDAIRAWIAKL